MACGQCTLWHHGPSRASTPNSDFHALAWRSFNRGIRFLHAEGVGVGFEGDIAIYGVGVRAWALGYIQNVDGSKCAHRGSAAEWSFTCMHAGSGTLNPKS